MSPEAYIYDAVRTPRGKGRYDGSLYEIKPVALLGDLLNALKERNELDPARIDDVVAGCVVPIGEQGSNIAKTAALYAGWDDSVPGMQLNRFCGSGLEAVNLAAMKVRSGWEDLVVAGGVESMSRVRMGSDNGPMNKDPETSIRIGYVPQGIGADVIATMEGFSREDIDAFALDSHRKAAAASENGYFSRSLVPVRDRNGLMILEHDETIRKNASMEKMAKLPPAFESLGSAGYDAVMMTKYPQLDAIDYVHTSASSSGIVDGAGMVLIGSEAAGKATGLTPRGRIVATATVGVCPTIMLLGPMPATRKVLAKAEMSIDDIDLFEVNEAFASVVMKFKKEMEVPPEKINVNGGAIAMGHPLGATGAMLLGTLLDELERRNLRYGLCTLCVAEGMGIATIIERL